MEAEPLINEATLVTPEVVPFTNGLSPQSLLLLSLALVAGLLIVIAFSRRKSRSRGDILLLLGPPDAGKTAILSTFAFTSTLQSHTSLQVNTCLVPLSPVGTLPVVDVPGHPRIRDQFQEYLGNARAVAFVVDASTISRNGSTVAEHLHHVLHAITSLPPSHLAPALLIVAHKCDLMKAATSSGSPAEVAISRVRTILERELEKRREAQSSGMGIEGLGAEGERSDMGGLDCSSPGGIFKFADWEGGEVDFAGTWVNVGELKEEEKGAVTDGLDSLRSWLVAAFTMT
ncbi:signal recognition particle receptor beta subunit-domain-containing protein [Suillus clintonianus]|uniref:signal recognition particle receptor beta subunit-domain-containing protein n=1 Tax=Suillus clintonianus TaxID=1904413 RepID=UPI001B86A634|nr:signal recognition particle receptor beta subunit-domain-containing protein [Suillus clintonianus]KAG2157261.1 signal recognition particle receptor beta subunit-domain-containing protein [Suillus clintonianus]